MAAQAQMPSAAAPSADADLAADALHATSSSELADAPDLPLDPERAGAQPRTAARHLLDGTAGQPATGNSRAAEAEECDPYVQKLLRPQDLHWVVPGWRQLQALADRVLSNDKHLDPDDLDSMAAQEQFVAALGIDNDAALGSELAGTATMPYEKRVLLVAQVCLLSILE